jgi:large subunit ribosomal protein L30
MNAKVKITLVKSTIGKPKKHCNIVTGLGLKKLNHEVELLDTPEVRGMIAKISHMLKIAR